MKEDGLLTAFDNFNPPIRMEGVEYRQVGLRHPFVAAPPTGHDWRLYVVRGENVVLEAPNLADGDRPLQSGTVIGMAGDEPHRFETAGPKHMDRLDAGWNERSLGMPLPGPGSDGDVVITVGRIPQSSMPFLSMMGGFVRIDPTEHSGSTARIGMLIDLIAQETVVNDPATGGIIWRLAEVITAEIGRVGRVHSVLFGNRPDDAEYDVRIWRAVTAICNEPQRHWTVGSMAQTAGMSRSAFASRFHETIGQTPMRSLRRLRMHRAAMALALPGSHAIVRVAEEMGYGSDAAFNRAFAKEFGHPPKRYSLTGRFDAERTEQG